MKKLLSISTLLIVLTLLFPIAVHLSSQVIAAEPPIGEVVNSRAQQSKTYYLGDGKYVVQSSLGPVHYQNNGWQEIDNAWVTGVLPWNWQMVQDRYSAYALSQFSSGQIMKFEVGASSVAFQPMDLQWTNALNQLQVISGPQGITATVNNTPTELLAGVNGTIGSLRWQGAYGSGRNFVWSTTPGLLKPLLEINSSLPTPAQYIINGGNVSLRQSFIFAPTSSLSIYVNEQLWNKSSTVLTTQPIEFRNGSETLWYFYPATCWSSNLSQESPLLTTRLRKAGSNLWLDVLVPYEWLQTAVYPIYIDPDTGVKYPGTASTQSVLPEDDVDWGSPNNIKANDGFYSTCVLPKLKVSYRLKATNFDFSIIPDGSTINGIVVEIERKASAADVLVDYRVQLLDAAGALVGNNLKSFDYYLTSDETVSYGLAGADPWNASPTAAMVKDSDFGVVMSTSTDDLSTTRTASVDFIRMTVYYTAPVAPTIHTDDATNVLSTTATINGEITATGGVNPTVTMFWGDNDAGTNATAWDNSAAPTSPAQPQGVAAFYKNVTGLSPGTLYYFSANGTNSGGTNWGTTKNFTTPCSASITVAPTSWIVNGGSPVLVNLNYSSGLTYFNVTNSGSGGAITVTIRAGNMTGGGYTWNLSDTATAGNMIYGLKAGLSGESYNITVKQNSPYNTLKAGLANLASQLFGLNLYTPTVYSDGSNKTGTVSLTAVCD